MEKQVKNNEILMFQIGTSSCKQKMLLNCHTYYSLCYGTFSTDELLDEVKQKGYSCFVLSDINNTSACIYGVKEAVEMGLKPILGIDFRNGIKQQYIGIARNNLGFKELNEHLSEHLHSGEKFEDEAPEFNHAYIIYPFACYKGKTLRENEFIGISSKELSQLQFSPAKNNLKKLVVLQPVTFAQKKHFNAHRLLRAIDKNTLLSKLSSDEQTHPDEIMPSKDKLYKTFAEYPQIIINTEFILNDCNIEITFGKFANKNLKHFTNSVSSDLELLKRKCYKNLPYRYKNANHIVMERLQKELDIIAEMHFASYFLINWDIINYARHKNYFYVGRGSGANSIVAYLLNITDVDPIELDLYFERFINPFRTNPPDFDIDFSWTDRDDITDYIFRRFGNDKKAALLGAYNTFQSDAVTRQLGKVFGLPAQEIDRLQKVQHPKDTDDIGRLVLNYSKLIHGFPAHLSIHSSGILISEEPITAYSATFMPPKGYPTTQFSMLEAEDIGLYKFDILSQRGLGKIKDTVEIVQKNNGIEIDIHDIKKFTSDQKVKDLLRVGKTIGCFYVESPAMRMLLAKLQADDYLRLVAASSIIRPGVSKSGMMREYILRFRNVELREKARKEIPELYNLLEETYGVMVYQEDVIKVAHFFAGLTLAEADYLRRGMSWKFKKRNEFNEVSEKFFNNCRGKGYEEKTINDIWNQIESFANFAFSKGHSASYAVESYQALYLKAYFPIEYMVATLNNGGGFYRMELYIHEARLHGANIEPPCVNHSEYLCVVKGKDIFLGLNMIGEVETPLVRSILEEREKNGAFKHLPDFVKRVNPSIEQIRLLIRVGALRFTKKNKKKLLWEAHSLISPIKKPKVGKELFEIEVRKFKLPELTDNWYDDAFDEIELLGFSLTSPFNLLSETPAFNLTAAELKQFANKHVEIIGYLVNVKHTSTSKGDRMYFGTFLDSEGMWIDTVHFPPSAKQYPFKGPGCYKLFGKVMIEFDFLNIEVTKMERLPTLDRENTSTRLKQKVIKV